MLYLNNKSVNQADVYNEIVDASNYNSLNNSEFVNKMETHHVIL